MMKNKYMQKVPFRLVQANEDTISNPKNRCSHYANTHRRKMGPETIQGERRPAHTKRIMTTAHMRSANAKRQKQPFTQ